MQDLATAALFWQLSHRVTTLPAAGVSLEWRAMAQAQAQPQFIMPFIEDDELVDAQRQLAIVAADLVAAPNTDVREP